jgi:hypothetical protein
MENTFVPRAPFLARDPINQEERNFLHCNLFSGCLSSKFRPGTKQTPVYFTHHSRLVLDCLVCSGVGQCHINQVIAYTQTLLACALR